MSEIDNPSQEQVQLFIAQQEGKKQTGNYFSAAPYVLGTCGVSALLLLSLTSSMTPTGGMPHSMKLSPASFTNVLCHPGVGRVATSFPR